MIPFMYKVQPQLRAAGGIDGGGGGGGGDGGGRGGVITRGATRT